MSQFECEMRETLPLGEHRVHTIRCTAGSHQEASDMARQRHPAFILLSTRERGKPLDPAPRGEVVPIRGSGSEARGRRVG